MSCAQQATSGSGSEAIAEASEPNPSEPDPKRHAPRSARNLYSRHTKLLPSHPSAAAQVAAAQAATAQVAAATAQPPMRRSSSATLPRRSTVGSLRVGAPSSIGDVLGEALQLAQANKEGKLAQGKQKAGKHKKPVVGPGTRAPDSSDEEEARAPPPPSLPRAEPPLPPTHSAPPPPVTFEGATVLAAAGTFADQIRMEAARRDEVRARLQRERAVQQRARSQAAAARLQLRVNEIHTEERQRQRNAAAVLKRMEELWSVMLSNPMRAFGSTCFIQVRSAASTTTLQNLPHTC